MSDPITAKQIAETAVYRLRTIREARSVSALNDIMDGWKLYAKNVRVCRQICEHFEQAYGEVRRDLLAHQKAATVARRMQGGDA